MSLPNSLILDLLHVDSAFRRKNQFDVFRTAIGGIRMSCNLWSKTLTLIFKVSTKELLFLPYATAMPPVCFYCTVS